MVGREHPVERLTGRRQEVLPQLHRLLQGSHTVAVGHRLHADARLGDLEEEDHHNLYKHKVDSRHNSPDEEGGWPASARPLLWSPWWRRSSGCSRWSGAARPAPSGPPAA